MLHPKFGRPLFMMAGIVLVVLVAFQLMVYLRPPKEVALATWTEPTLPDTAAGRKFEAYLDVLNSGDTEALRAFVREHFSPVGPGGGDIDDRIRSQVRLANESRGLNLYEVTDDSEFSVTVTAQMRLTQEWKEFTFILGEEPPHLVTGMMFLPADAPVIAHSDNLSDEELGQQIDGYVSDLVAADRFSGVVLVARDGNLLFQEAYGAADQARETPNRLSTHFSVASVGKMFTAVAIAQLVEAGNLSYAGTIDRYLPDYPAAVAQQVTIDHLLTHRSGIIDFFAGEEKIAEKFATVKDSLHPQRDYLPLFMDEPLRFPPGERFEYSNSNYILLGAIIEEVSGQSYEDYLHSHIFEPAGMTETSLTVNGIESDLVAHGYTEMDENGEMTPGERRSAAAHPHQTPTGSAAGGAFTTAGDLLRFDRALRTHQLLSSAATDQLMAGRVDYERPGYRYGYGFIMRQVGDERIVGHSGGFVGVDAQFEMYLDSGYTVIVLSNYEGVAEPVVIYIQQVLPL